MGLLSEGSPLSWEETKKYADHVRRHGIVQFIKLYHRLKDRQNDCLKWGDEIEYMIIKLDHANQTAKVCLKAEKLLSVLQEKEKENLDGVNALWRPEFGAYMIEGTPGKPYGALSSCFNVVEANMRARRFEAEELLESDETLLCLTSFPRLGCPDFTFPSAKLNPKESALRSLFFPDEAVFGGHPRFKTLARNIRQRRNKKVIINVPNIDHLLSQHIAHLFIRDPITLFSEKINQNDDEDSDHFENIQSTNWQTMRFKPPPPNSSIGWRVEFRSMEVQMTEFENAAYVVFIVLLTRVILSFQLNLLIPLSKVDENLAKAQKRDAILTEKFWFRKDLTTCESPPVATEYIAGCCNPNECQYTQMTINEIINGKKNEFPGLVPLIQKFLSSMDVDVDTQCSIQQYLQLIKLRAKGELMTPARWIRDFVSKHPNYKFDSVVDDLINYDLLLRIDKITQGKEECPELLGKPLSRSKEHIPSAVSKAEKIYSNTLNNKIS
ncbi:glutamate--cysteine ligase catalytic subunit [Trichonephila inaurata madagascariensis]|uniref:Glutamate--cysteine ligase n=1 Tax=Trichonephila inaurata madagascariensis TaxID=2747483 RepID=A0A8X6IN48_9ARAC|nr:glutamate--cysteine ligase catalytic subunit [Trichonephila inaurata madagascariensis]